MKADKKGAYIPALKYHWMTRFYDPLIQWGMQEKKLRVFGFHGGKGLINHPSPNS